MKRFFESFKTQLKALGSNNNLLYVQEYLPITEVIVESFMR